MKKKHLTILTILLATCLNSWAQTKSSSPALTKDNANKIIGMTNGVIDIYNDQTIQIKYVGDCLKLFDNSMNNIAENPNGTANGASCSSIRSLRTDLVNQMKKKAALAPSFPEKKAILEGIDQLDKEFEISKERCKVIQTYLTSKKYKEDDEKFSSYIALRDSFVETYQNINNLFSKTMNLTTATADRAELVVLKSHPLAPIVIPMKSTLSAVSEIMAECRSEKPDAENIKANIAAVRKSIEKDKVITPAKKTAMAKVNGGTATFDSFYKYTAVTLDKADLFLEYLDPKKEVTIDHVFKETEEDARNRHLKRQYGEISKYYGVMVDAYNTL